MNDMTRVLVVHGGERGTTGSIAGFVASRLRTRGAVVDLRAATAMPDVTGYDAVVVGGAVRERALLPVVEDFLLRNAEALRAKPVWLFSVGLTPSLRGPVGRLLRDEVPPRIAALCELIGPRDYQAFAGVVPRGESAPPARALFWLCGGRYGDLRDWPRIEAWTSAVAAGLPAAAPAR